eukprot:4398508-Alexandrium_andersonii.AAC.1
MHGPPQHWGRVSRHVPPACHALSGPIFAIATRCATCFASRAWGTATVGGGSLRSVLWVPARRLRAQ